MVGTVQAVCLPTNQVYLVQFDGRLGPELAPEQLLEPVDQERPPAP
jgi:hypothetical protein